MDTFWVVTLFHVQPNRDQLSSIEELATQDFGALGIEEFSLNEAQVDELLGERSYSGGDLPLEVLEEVEEKVLAAPGNYRFFFAEADQALAFKQAVEKNLLAEIQIEECPQEDWNAEWKKHYAPIYVNENLEIVPSWQPDYQSTAKHKLMIYPGMGFGTGSHETTFLCLRLFTEELLNAPSEKILDFGSGSGILGLASLLFFPEARVDFYDIDPEANKNCFDNAKLNGLEERAFRLLLPEYRDLLLPTYDVVFANILESILLQEREALIQHTKSGGYLVLSGLLRHQVPNIIEAYVGKEVKLIRQLEKGDWAALLLQKGQ